MPISAEYLTDHPIEVRARGEVTAGELAQLVQDAHPLITESCPPLLIDARDLQSLPELDDLRRILRDAHDIPGIDKCRIAVVTNSDWMYGVGRAIATYASFVGLAFAAFREEAAARLWLRSVDP